MERRLLGTRGGDSLGSPQPRMGRGHPRSGPARRADWNALLCVVGVQESLVKTPVKEIKIFCPKIYFFGIF